MGDLNWTSIGDGNNKPRLAKLLANEERFLSCTCKNSLERVPTGGIYY